MPVRWEMWILHPKKNTTKLCLPVVSAVRGADEVVATWFPPGRRDAEIDRLPQTASKRRLLISRFCPLSSVSLFISLPLSVTLHRAPLPHYLYAHAQQTRTQRRKTNTNAHDCRLINASDCIQSKSLMNLRWRRLQQQQIPLPSPWFALRSKRSELKRETVKHLVVC